MTTVKPQFPLKPFRPSNYAVLDDCGVTGEQAGKAVDAAIKELDAQRKAARMQTFTGKLSR